jgi:hypothetical protein
MELHNFLSLLAACFGLSGSIFLARGIIGLSPKNMLRLTSPYSRIGYAPEQIYSMAAQKADALIGAIYIFLAFLVQVGALIFVEHSTVFVKDKWTSVCIALVATLLVTIIFSLMDKAFRNHTKFAIGKVAIRDHCAGLFAGIIDPVNAKSLEKMAQELLNINRGDSETTVDFIKRIAKDVNWEIPKETDFSRIAESNKDR